MSSPGKRYLSNDGRSLYVQPDLGGVVSKIVWNARKKMFDLLMKRVSPGTTTTVVDIGVTSDNRQDSNFFEKLYPYPHQITAVGLEDASFLEQDYPGLTFVKADGVQLPFPDKSFDLAVSFAVIEHVGSRERQQAFIRELCRVGRVCYITTPNRWYPVEFHSILPFVHWLPAPWFRSILKLLGKTFFAKEENLNLLSARELLNMFPNTMRVYPCHHKLLGLTSNLVFYLETIE